MKKYLFLFFLFIIYIYLYSKNSTSPAISYENKYDGNVCDISVLFLNGKNSESIKQIFKNYKSEYYVYEIKVKDDSYDVSCNNIDDCLNNIYETEDMLFEISHKTTGFSVQTISLISYTDDIIPFLNKNNLSYKIK